MCQELYDHREHLWTFLKNPQVEPTNNAAERSLRHGVIWRRLSFGTQSERGDRFGEVMLTIVETCRQRHRNVLQFVTHALTTKTPSQPRTPTRPARGVNGYGLAVAACVQ